MFLLGAAKNLGAKPLTDSVDSLLDVIRAITGRECLVPESDSISLSKTHTCSHGALVAAGRAVRGCFDQLDLDARRAVASLSRHLASGKGEFRTCGSLHMPDLDMIFTQAALQAAPGATRRHSLRAATLSRRPIHRRPSEPTLMMASPAPTRRRFSLPGTMAVMA